MVDTGRQIERATGHRHQQRRRGKKGREIVSYVYLLLLGVGGIIAAGLAVLLPTTPNAEARSSDAVRLPSWFIKLFPECRGPTILVFQENAGSILTNVTDIAAIARGNQRLFVFISLILLIGFIGYWCNSSMLSREGYGTSGGYPSQHGIIKEAQMDPPSHMQMLSADIRQCTFVEFPTSMCMNGYHRRKESGSSQNDNYRQTSEELASERKERTSQNDNFKQTSEKHFSGKKESKSSQNNNYKQISEKHFLGRKKSGSTQNDKYKQTSEKHLQERKKSGSSKTHCFWLMIFAQIMALFYILISFLMLNRVREA